MSCKQIMYLVNFYGQLIQPLHRQQRPMISYKASGSPYEEIGKICCNEGGLQSLSMYRRRLSQIWGSSNLVQYSSLLLACQELSMANTNCLSKLCSLGTFFAHFCIEINNLVPVRSVSCLINQPRSQYTWILAQEMINKQFSCHDASH